MTPSQTGARYDRIAEWWGQRHAASGYGVAQLERSISFVPEKDRALDVGCGSSGRFMGVLLDHGFETEGMDAWFESSAEDWLGDEQAWQHSHHTGPPSQPD